MRSIQLVLPPFSCINTLHCTATAHCDCYIIIPGTVTVMAPHIWLPFLIFGVCCHDCQKNDCMEVVDKAYYSIVNLTWLWTCGFLIICGKTCEAILLQKHLASLIFPWLFEVIYVPLKWHVKGGEKISLYGIWYIWKKNTKINKNTWLQSAMVVSRAGNLITDNCYGSLTKAGSETG